MVTVRPAARRHGGPDAAGPVRWDFSTNANAAGPCPQAVSALGRADATRYPDPDYQALRKKLATWHAVAPDRILLAASASEFIQRITAVGQRLAPGPVAVPTPSYGDYAVAACAWGRIVVNAEDDCATLRWCCDPGSPLGQDASAPTDPTDRPTVLDAAYAPLRLTGRSPWSPAARDGVFQLFSPNKALGLTGVRGGYAIAPVTARWPVQAWCDALDRAQPSWPLGADGVALLDCWTDDAIQSWLAASRVTLQQWTLSLRSGLDRLGLQPQASVTPFLCARRPAAAEPSFLRARGLAVRDTTSLGLPGWMRLSAQQPEALDALLTTLQALQTRQPERVSR